jgi:hypothetical protein
MSMRRATVHLVRRRLVRSLGYRGPHPRRVFVLGLVVVVLADALLTLTVVAWVRAQDATPDPARAIVATVALLVAYAVAGPGALLVAGVHDVSHAGVLEALPVRRAQVRASLELPSLVVVQAAVGLMVPPTVAALVAVQVPFGAALLTVAVTTAVAAAMSAVSLALVVAARVASTAGARGRLIRWNRWNRSNRPRLVVADLLYALRNPVLVSNLVAAAAVSTALVVVLLRISPGTARMIVTPVLIGVPFLAGQSVRMLRGRFPATNPPPQLAGVTMAGWVFRVDLVAVLLFAVVLLPAVAIALRGDLLAVLDRGEYLRAVLTCLAVSLLLTWVLPGHTSDPAGQVVAVLSYLLIAATALWGVHVVAGYHPAAALVVAGGLLVTTIAASPRIERARWQPTGRRRDTSIAATERLSAR